MPLDLTGGNKLASEQGIHDAELDAVKKNHADVEVTKSGIEAEIDTTRKGFTFTAYVKRLWNGQKEAGAKISKDF